VEAPGGQSDDHRLGISRKSPLHSSIQSREDAMARVDVSELRDKVKVMYKAVAEEPHGTFHFEMGRDLALRLGYPPADLDRLPPEAIESFAGVGYHLGLAAITTGERVVDLGSGSGTDLFLAAHHAGVEGEVVGVDMTQEQLAKARHLAARDGYSTVRLELGYIEHAPVADRSADVVISNGVINLCDDKTAVFREIARMLKPGGRTAISDIVTERQLTEAIIGDVNLWASCIGGAMQQDDYRRAIEDAGLEIHKVEQNPQYRFISDSAQGATKTFGVKSISVLAAKPG
jgi:arsenite methyltransferase